MRKPRLAGGSSTRPFEIPVGSVAVLSDPFGNPLVLAGLCGGRYTTTPDGRIKEVK